MKTPFAAALALSCAACGSADALTFNRDVAPIVYAHCAVCHRPGESGPFSLLTYRDVARRADQIVDVTRSGYMPPWLPAPGEHPFDGERRLEPREIDTIARWFRAGTVEGDAADLPSPPEWSAGWRLGEPDLVVTLDRDYVLAPEGRDVFRNFVIPVPVEGPRWVRAVELRPGSKRVVHHAILRIDRTPATRRIDEADPAPGFDGMEMGHSLAPDGHFLGWTPGKSPGLPQADTAWRLDVGTDLVLQLHLLPSGRPERLRPSVGLYFADGAPDREPSMIGLYIENIDIPAGERRHVREDRFVLPVPVEVRAVYPHAHYLGREIRAWAELPGGGETTLIHIPNWDFNWQDDYWYRTPVPLPAGSTIVLRWVYDNSKDNVRNPNYPPARVRSGNRSTDEMGSLALQVQTRNDHERALLDAAKARDLLAQLPDSWRDLNNLGNALQDLGRVEEAIPQYRRALELNPDLDDARYNLGTARMALGDVEGAMAEFRRVLETSPDYAKAHNNLGNALLSRGRPDEAIEQFRRALALEPSLEVARYNLGNALLARERYDEAAEQFRATLEIAPRDAMAHNNLGTALHLAGRIEEAIAEYEAALALEPDLVEARTNLDLALAARGRAPERPAR